MKPSVLCESLLSRRGHQELDSVHSGELVKALAELRVHELNPVTSVIWVGHQQANRRGSREECRRSFCPRTKAFHIGVHHYHRVVADFKNGYAPEIEDGPLLGYEVQGDVVRRVYDLAVEEVEILVVLEEGWRHVILGEVKESLPDISALHDLHWSTSPLDGEKQRKDLLG